MTDRTIPTAKAPRALRLCALAVSVATLTACAHDPGSEPPDPWGSEFTVSGPEHLQGDGDRWTVGVAYPRFAEDETCTSDAVVETSVMTASMPSTGMIITLIPEATEADAQRIADCLTNALTNGAITITSPAQEQQ